MLHGVPPKRISQPAPRAAVPAAGAAGSEFGDLMSVLLRYWKSVLGCALAGALLAILAATLIAPRYHATAQILIDPHDLRLLDNEVSPRSVASDSGIAAVESQVHVMASENVLRRMIAETGLIADPEFNGTRRGFIGRLTDPIRRLSGPRVAEDGEAADPVLAVLQTVRRRTQIRRTERTYVVDVTTWAETRAKAVKIANGIVHAYLDELAASKAAAVRGAGEAIGARLEGLRKNVSAAEERAARYKSEHNLIGAGGRLVNEQQLTEINNQLTLARAETGRAKAKLDEMRNSRTSPETLPEAVRSDTLRALRTQLSTVSGQRARLGAQLQAAHPDMVALNQQEAQIRRAIGEELRRIMAASERDYQRASAAEEGLATQLDELRRQLVETNEAQVQLRELDRDLEANRAIYQSAIVRTKEAREQAELNTTNAQVITTASQPRDRTFPPPLSLLAPGGLLIGAAAGGALALLRQLLVARRRGGPAALIGGGFQDPGAFVFADFRGLCKGLGVVGEPSSGGLQHSLMELARSVVDKPGSEFAQKIEDLERVLDEAAEDRERADDAGPRIVLFAPDRTNPAKSAVALGLTYAAIKRGARVLLVDGDPQGRQLSQAVGCRARLGIEDVVSGRARLSAAVIADDASHLGFLPAAGRPGALPSPRAVRQAMSDMADYDLVIIDGTPLGGAGLGEALAATAGEMLFVFGTGPGAEGDIAEAMHVLRQSTPKFRGIVLTD